jgi:hypothetical protein
LSNTAPSTGAAWSRGDTIRAIVVPIVLLGLAAFLGSGYLKFSSPVAPAPTIPAWATDTATIRHPKLRPEISFGAYTYRCSDCHRLFESPPETKRSVSQHRDVVLKHGINDRCFNCHNRENRDTFTNARGEPLPFDQPQLLCAKCHGPVYRDWLQGVHGRTNGYWDRALGPADRKTCVQCHDPHVPPFPPMPPAPPPVTLRMGNQRPFPVPPEEQKNPLLIYRELPSVEDEATSTTRPAEPASGVPGGDD